MLRIAFAFGFLFFQNLAWSFEFVPVTRFRTTTNSKIYWTLYSENGVTKVDVIEEKNSEAQQVIQSWGFSRFDKAEEFYNSKTAGYVDFNEQLWSGETQTVKSQPNKRLWEATNSWTWDWELKYAKWIADHVDKTFMQKYNIPSDCADLAYIVRWIFARQNSLPVANKLSSTGKFMTHETVLKEWENLSTDPDWSKDKLFRTALRYLTRQTYTHILMRDSYPIALNSESITEGVHHLQLREKSGHTMLVYKIDHTGGVPVRVLYSNVPIEVRELYESPFNDVSWPEADKRAFLRFRWPQKTSTGWSLIPAAKMPYYSLEQFSEDITKEGPSFFVVAFKRIAPNFNPLNLIEENLNSIFSQFENRVRIVEEGFKYCQSHDCSPGTAGDEDWSTPSRDQRIRDTFEAMSQAIDLFMEMTEDGEFPQKIADQMKNYQLFIQGETYGFVPLYVSSMIELMNSDPRVSIGERWTLKPEAIAKRLEGSLIELFKKRDEKIKFVGSCAPSDCPLGSKKWIEKSTAELDTNISNIFLKLRIMCGVLKESCSEFNQIFKTTKKFMRFFSKAVTQHTSPSSTIEQRQGTEEYRVQFVPDRTVPIVITENVFFQAPHLYRQAVDEIFPEILCSEALLNPKDTSKLICIKREGETTIFEFMNKQLQVTHRLQAPSNQLTTHFWLENTELFILIFESQIKIYTSQGQFIAETDLLQYYNIIGKRWLSTLDAEKYLSLLDLANVQKGWIRQNVRTYNELNNVDAFPIADTGFFLISDEQGVYITNQAGEITFTTNERLYQITDKNKSLITITNYDEFKVYKLYQIEKDGFKYVTEIKVQSDQIDWVLYRTETGYFYGNKLAGYTIFEFANQEHHHLDWTKGKVLSQIASDSLVFVDQLSPTTYGLYNLLGEQLLKNPYLMLQHDPLHQLTRLSFFVENIFYNQTYKIGQLNSPLFSNTGFFYTPQSEDETLNHEWRLNPIPNSHIFGLAGGKISLPLLSRLGVNLNYDSVLLTMPSN